MLKYFRPITYKKDTPEEEDPPEGKELGHIYRKLYPYRHRYQLLATCIANADITRVLKQAKRSFT